MPSAAAPVAGGWHAGADDPTATEFVLRIEQMHMAALATAKSGRFAEHLGGHAVQRHALGDGEVMRPVRADHRIFLAQMSTHPHGHRLLSGG
jgi:hypothetical protein